MPRWPAGLYVAAGSQRAVGASPVRPPATGQRDYWRQVAVPLHAGASALYPQLLPVGSPSFSVSASTGPQGVGERWVVDVVQVQTADQYGQPPLVVQQLAGQLAGTTVIPPPPVVAQAWLSVAGQKMHLLAQTTSGGNDDLSVACPPLSAGEAVTVVWYGLLTALTSTFAAPAWFRLRGTKYVLSVM